MLLVSRETLIKTYLSFLLFYSVLYFPMQERKPTVGFNNISFLPILFHKLCCAFVKRVRGTMREQEWFLDLVTDQRDPCVTSSPHGKVRKESETKQPLKGKILILDSRFCVLVRCGIRMLRVSSLNSASTLARACIFSNDFYDFELLEIRIM